MFKSVVLELRVKFSKEIIALLASPLDIFVSYLKGLKRTLENHFTVPEGREAISPKNSKRLCGALKAKK